MRCVAYVFTTRPGQPCPNDATDALTPFMRSGKPRRRGPAHYCKEHADAAVGYMTKRGEKFIREGLRRDDE